MRDSLLRDAVAPVAEAGRVPDTQGMNDYIVDILEGMDRKAKDRPAPPKQAPPKFVEQKRYEGQKIISIDSVEGGMRGRLIERIRLIRRYPEMVPQLKNLSICLNSPKMAVRHQAGEALIRLVDKTNAIVGYDWRQPKPEKLVFSG